MGNNPSIGGRKVSDTSRRRFLKATGTSIAAGSLGTLATGSAAAADRTYISITETRGIKTYYQFEITTVGTPFYGADLQGEGGSLESNDEVQDPDKGNAIGYVNDETDTYSFTGQLERMEIQGDIPGGSGDARVEVDLTGGYNYTGDSGVEIGGEGDYESETYFDTTDSVSAPGDGSLESNDIVGSNYARSYIYSPNGYEEDHFNMSGNVNFMAFYPKDTYVYFTRSIGSTW